MIWGKVPVDYRVPEALNFPAFTLWSTNFPAFRMFMLLMSVAVFIALVLSLGQACLSFQVGMAVAIDTVMLTLFAIYLFTHSSTTP